MRRKRKLDHLNLARLMDDGPLPTGFADIHFVPNCLPELDFGEISTVSSFLGRNVAVPFFINAISGGVAEAKELNRALAYAACQTGIPMAVGSMTAAIEDRSLRHTFTVVREENPDGFVAANLSAGAKPHHCLTAVEMLRADALQLHLNAPQEVMMREGEGDLSFSGFLQNIMDVVELSPVPVIVKEVGFGIAEEQARLLQAAGAAALDTGGGGGTNFIRIESVRKSDTGAQPFFPWGLPAVVSLLEVVACTTRGGNAGAAVPEIVASGGVRSGLDAAKALALGASLAGVAGPLVRSYYQGGREALLACLQLWQHQLRQAMFMLGVSKPALLKKRPLVVLGETGNWLALRGIDARHLARRRGGSALLNFKNN
ncbi:MAG TPA: type 2 isopentenyl-diphosphate Delta-isomerase [Firmicutes bacterium]|nr:type 2 isopentenyl-diphosphate Delta-isomerase [Bacillota bacterium]